MGREPAMAESRRVNHCRLHDLRNIHPFTRQSIVHLKSVRKLPTFATRAVNPSELASSLFLPGDGIPPPNHPQLSTCTRSIALHTFLPPVTSFPTALKSHHRNATLSWWSLDPKFGVTGGAGNYKRLWGRLSLHDAARDDGQWLERIIVIRGT